MKKKKILCPSILNLPIENLKEEIIALDQTDIDIFHIDIMDGTFVPNFGMTVREIDLIRKYTDKLVDCHLMMENPGRYVGMMAEHGCDIIYIHPESEQIPTETLCKIRELGKCPGIAVNPGLSVEMVHDLLYLSDYVMIMGVNPGFAGRDFMDYLVPKIEKLAKVRETEGFDYKIILDGGADERVIKKLYHDYGIEGYILGKQLLFGQDRPYGECVDFIRSI